MSGERRACILKQFGDFKRHESYFQAMGIDFWKCLFHVDLSASSTLASYLVLLVHAHGLGQGVGLALGVGERRVKIVDVSEAVAPATPRDSVLDLRTTTSQKCEAVPRRARI